MTLTQPTKSERSESAESVAIVGAGPAGSLLALALAREGYSVDVYERRADPRAMLESGGRSINLGLSKRGMEALGMVGLLADVLDRGVAMRGRVIHSLDGGVRFQPYGASSEEVLYSVDRNELNLMLLERAAGYPTVRLHFDHRLVRMDKERREIGLHAGGVNFTVQPRFVIGADGAFSTVRRELQHGERADYHQEFLEWGYKEFTLPARPDGSSAVELTALHLWPRSHCLIVSHPNRNGSHTLTLFLPFSGAESFASTRTADEVEALFRKYFPDLVPLLPDYVEQWMNHEAASLVTTRTSPWRSGDWAVLVGDACHSVYPFYGQGMNSAFEDCVVLMRTLRGHPTDLVAAFSEYEQARRPHTDVLCELSKTNFVELRQKVRSPWFHARKRLDLAIHRLLPQWWLPLYTMIAHTTIPYADALARARKQERILVACSTFLMLAAVGMSVIMALRWHG